MPLFMRTCDKDMTGYGGFVWPSKIGEVATAPDWDDRPECGGGLHGLLSGEGHGELLDWTPDAVWLAFESDTYVDLGGKCKAPNATIRAIGTREEVTSWMVDHCPLAAVVGADVHADYGGTATADYRGTATADDGGTATAGEHGTATAGNRGTATAGEYGTARAGEHGTATAGQGGTIVIRYWDGARARVMVGYPGEDGIVADAPYVVSDGELVRVPVR